MANNRLFFALMPTSKIVNSITQNTVELSSSIQGNLICPINWHVTLAFIGNVENKTRDCLIKQSDQIQAAAFSLVFDKVLYFKKSKILSYGVSPNTDVNPLNFLFEQCRYIQSVCGLEIEKREFTAHISLARKVSSLNKNLILDPLLWQVNEFALVNSLRSEQGSVYTVLKSWSLLA